MEKRGVPQGWQDTEDIDAASFKSVSSSEYYKEHRAASFRFATEKKGVPQGWLDTEDMDPENFKKSSEYHIERINSDDVDAKISQLVGPDEQRLLTLWYSFLRDGAHVDPNNVIQETPFTAALLKKLDANLEKNGIKHDEFFNRYIKGRQIQSDKWTEEFLSRHQFEDSLVVQVCCGLDHRNARMNLGEGVKWIDLDNPRMVGIRERLFPAPQGDYELRAADVGGDDDTWLKDIPSNRPVLIIMETLLYFLEPEKGRRLIRRLLAHFPEGNLICDTFGNVAVACQGLVPAITKERRHAPFKWGIDNAEELIKLNNRLVLRDRVYSHEHLSVKWFGKGCPPMFGGWGPLVALFPNVSHPATKFCILAPRYEFLLLHSG